MLATYVLFYLMTTFSLSYGRAPVEPGPGQLPGLGYSYNDFVLMLIFGVVFFGIFTLISGPLADRWGRRKTLIMVTLGIIAFALLWVPLLSDRKSTRLNSSHVRISYAVFCLKKKKKKTQSS